MKKKVRICWACSDFVYHEHRWRWAAWICGRVQRLINYRKNKLLERISYRF